MAGSDRAARWYGQWAGNERGTKEDPLRCIEEVWPNNGLWIPCQCRRKRGFGPDGLYCKQHGKIEEERRARQA